MEHEHIIVSATVTLARNYADLPFDAATNADTAARAVSRTANALEREGFTLRLLREMTEDSRQVLVEAGQVRPEFMNEHKAGAVLQSLEGHVTVAVGGDEHVGITARCPGDGLMQALAECCRVEDCLSGSATFAFDAQLGYVTAQHRRLGTGLTAQMTLHLPLLLRARRLPELISYCKQEGLQIAPSTAPEQLAGELLTISNAAALGRTEQEICQQVKRGAEHLCQLEIGQRRRMLQEQPLRLQDKVSRALGVMRYAHLMGQTDFRHLWSDVRLGAALALLPLSVTQVDALMPEALDAHLRSYAEEPLAGEALDACRASRVQELLEEYPLA